MLAIGTLRTLPRHEPTADSEVTDAHIVVNFDDRTIDKYITGGDF